MLKTDWKTELFVAMLAFVVRWPSLKAVFVFDDRPALVNNKDIFNSSENESWSSVFQNDFWGTPLTSNHSHKSYRPLTTLTFKANAILGGEDPFYFHVVNVLLHVVNCALVLRIVKILKKKLAFGTSLIVAVHPIHTEPVSEIVGRADILWAFWALVAILSVLKNSKRQSIKVTIFVLTCSTLALLCKEQGVMTVPMMLSLTYLKHKRFHLKTTVVFGLYLAIATLTRLKVMNFQKPKFQEGDNPAAFLDSRFWRSLNFNYIYAYNALLMILPSGLCFDWAMGCFSLITNLNDFRISVIALFWLSMIGLLCSRRSSWTALTMLILPFLPSANLLVTVGFVIAERNLYFSVIGYAMIIAQGVRKVPKLKPLFIVMILTFMAKSFHRGLEWQSERVLFTSGLKVCPGNAKIYYNLAKLSDDRSLAKKLYFKAIDLWPRYEHALNNVGNILKAEGLNEEAEQLFLRALEVNPEFAAAYMNLGIAQTNLGKYAQAEQSYIEALKHRRKYPDCHFNLGTLYLKIKQPELALEAFENAITLNPEHSSAWANQIILLDELNRFGKAEKKAKQALAIFPERPEFYFHLANIYGKTEQYELSESNYMKALNLGERNPGYHLNLGILYHRWKKPEKAAQSYEAALRLDPKNQNAQKYLKSVRKQLLKK